MEYKTATSQHIKPRRASAACAQNIEQTISQFVSRVKSRFKDQITRDARGPKRDFSSPFSEAIRSATSVGPQCLLSP
jgi:hypothetical protein